MHFHMFLIHYKAINLQLNYAQPSQTVYDWNKHRVLQQLFNAENCIIEYQVHGYIFTVFFLYTFIQLSHRIR